MNRFFSWFQSRGSLFWIIVIAICLTLALVGYFVGYYVLMPIGAICAIIILLPCLTALDRERKSNEDV